MIYFHDFSFGETVNFFLPLALRSDKTRRPVAVSILARNPCVRILFFQRLFTNIFKILRKRVPVYLRLYICQTIEMYVFTTPSFPIIKISFYRHFLLL